MSFHCYTPLKFFFKKFNLRIFNYKLTKVQGGSIRFYVCHDSAIFKNSKNLESLEKIELNKFQINKHKTYTLMQKEIDLKKNRVNKLLSKLLKKKKF